MPLPGQEWLLILLLVSWMVLAQLPTTISSCSRVPPVTVIIVNDGEGYKEYQQMFWMEARCISFLSEASHVTFI